MKTWQDRSVLTHLAATKANRIGKPDTETNFLTFSHLTEEKVRMLFGFKKMGWTWMELGEPNRMKEAER